MKFVLYYTCFSWKRSSLHTVISVHYCVKKYICKKKEKEKKKRNPGVPEPQT